ncbi:DUF427 domain-containing protein [Oerskovia sp. Sa1BUA8]|uniref:DUF427 domain-containing protein n=1 Tax=Oerskovia douganii TaxID=2762210 RepID=A0A9D5YYF1_9CELL|nr:DUF427 domain-containing protein [Oerskovia douganii]
MATSWVDRWQFDLDRLRWFPAAQTIRAVRRDDPRDVVLTSTTARLVWEPGRVLPVYAVPESDVRVPLVEGEFTDGAPGGLIPHPLFFDRHTCPGTELWVDDALVPTQPPAGPPGTTWPAPFFRLDDEDLAGYVAVDFQAFDWFAEDQPLAAHPRDPFKRVDVVPSSRHVVVSLDGVVLADSTRPMALTETYLPLRWYVPRDDVHWEALTPSDTTSACAYKGLARYWSTASGGPRGGGHRLELRGPAVRCRAGPRPRRVLVRAHRPHARRRRRPSTREPVLPAREALSPGPSAHPDAEHELLAHLEPDVRERDAGRQGGREVDALAVELVEPSADGQQECGHDRVAARRPQVAQREDHGLVDRRGRRDLGARGQEPLADLRGRHDRRGARAA